MKKVTILTELTDKDIEEIKAMNIKKARKFYALHSYTTKRNMSIKTKLPAVFVHDNWDEITK